MVNNPNLGIQLKGAIFVTKNMMEWAEQNGGAQLINDLRGLRDKYRMSAAVFRERKRLAALPIEQLEALAERTALRARMLSGVLKELTR